MSDHYVALNDGVEGFLYSDFITGTASTITRRLPPPGPVRATSAQLRGRVSAG